jgi:CRP/FNR family transcriptional regulator, anaerobic regulatory protein
MSTQLIAHIRKFVELSDTDAEFISDKLPIIKIKKKDFVLIPGKHCKTNYFVLKGCMRLYFISKKETEQITQFAIENWWITDYDSVDSGKPSHFYIQAVEDTELIVMDQPTEQLLTVQIPVFERYLRIMLQKAFTAAQRRMEMLNNMTDEERYINFTTRFPDFNQRIPQYMVASYLGVTPQFVSRVRARKTRIS